jgi:hypothetical protein
MIIYSNITRDTTLTGTDALHDIFKKHWVNAVKLYEQHGYDRLSARNVTVYGTCNTDLVDMNIVSELEVDYDVIYFEQLTERDIIRYEIQGRCFDNFVCEYSVFFRLMSNWREITTMLDQPNQIFFLSRILEYQNITVRQSDFLKVNE